MIFHLDLWALGGLWNVPDNKDSFFPVIQNSCKIAFYFCAWI